MAHDPAYKLLFSHVHMVIDLLRGFVKEPWIEELDFSTLDKVSGSYVSDDLRDRHSDIIWRVQWGSKLLYIYILLEFQSTVDRYMAVRIQTYTGLLYQDLIRRQQLPDNANLPPILPIVLYNGARPWNAVASVQELIEPGPQSLARYQPNAHYLLLDEARLDEAELSSLERNLVAAIFRLGRSQTLPSLLRLAKAAAQLINPDDPISLQHAMIEWIRNRLLPDQIANASLPAIEAKTLSELVAMLTEHEIDWTRNLRQAGQQEGQRSLILKQTRIRFDDETVESLTSLLENITDIEVLADIGTLLITSDHQQTFLNQVKARLSENNGQNGITTS